MISENKTSKKRLIGLDYLKTIAIIMVIALHVPVFRLNFIQSGKIFNLVQYSLRLLTEGVPLFLIVNGFLLFRKEKIDCRALYKKTFIYFCLYLLFGSLTIIIMNIDQPLPFNKFMVNLLTVSSGQSYVGSLWYIQSLIATYLIFPILYYIYKNNYSLFKTMFNIVVFFTIGKQTILLIAEILIRVDIVNYAYLTHIGYAFSKFDPSNMSSFLLFFMLGAYVNQNLDILSSNLKKLWFASILGWILSIIYAVILSNMNLELLQPAIFYGSIIMVIQAITVFVTFIRMKEKGTLIEKITRYISSSTLWIYFVHNIIIYLFRLHHDFSSFVERITLLILVLLVSLVISAAIRLINKTINLLRL